jgi:hypothetical protein
LPFTKDIVDDSYPELITLLEGQQYAKANILICWHHGKIMDFASALLAVNGQPTPNLPSASTWPGSYLCSVFGWLLQIRLRPPRHRFAGLDAVSQRTPHARRHHRSSRQRPNALTVRSETRAVRLDETGGNL